MQRLLLNFGPQHPSAHGLLRLVVELDGETIVNIEPHIGFLHRGVEKIIEAKTYQQIIPFIDRLDYVSALCNEHAFILAIEKLSNTQVPERAQYIRVLFDELTRILSHLLWLGSHALDIGVMSLFLYAMREREKLLDCYELLSGSRMHPKYYRPGGVKHDVSEKLLDLIAQFSDDFPRCLTEYEKLLTNNVIWKKRIVNIGQINAERAIALGFTGPMLRATGVDWDLRKKQPYEVYDKLDFKVPLATEGDCYARYLLHIAEMEQSNLIMQQCVAWLKKNPGEVRTKLSQKPEGEVYSAIEHPKGEFGIYLIADGSDKPYRVKIRAASFPYIAGLNELCRGHMLADLVAIVSSTDVMFGEIDR